MSAEEVITLDSGDEADFGSQQANHASNGNVGVPSYANALPGPSMTKSASVSHVPLVTPPRPPMPKRPGQFPPFGLFSQEQRKEILKENPNLSFGEIGRILGEKWHALDEKQREEYRVRARNIHQDKIKEWEKQVKKINLRKPHPQIRLNPTLAAQRRRQTQGYTIFSSERKKMYLAQGLNLAEVTQLVGQEWRSATPQLRQSYEARAAKINMLEKGKQGRIVMQQKPHQGATQRNQPQQAQQRNIPMSGRRPHLNLPANTSLRISKVTSLSPVKPSQTQGSTGPNLNLPKGISISRVDPDISIVKEQRPRSQPQLQQSHRQILKPVKSISTRSQPIIRATRGRPPLHLPLASSLQNIRTPRGTTISPMQGLVGSPGRTPINPRLLNQQKPVLAGRKRPMPNEPQHLPSLRMRLPPPPIKRSKIGSGHPDLLGIGPPLLQSSLSPINKYCRLCGEVYPKNGPMYGINCHPKIIEKIDNTLALKINVSKDEEEGYPTAICRKCCHIIFTFDEYKQKVDEGLARLSRIVALKMEQQKKLEELNHDAAHPTTSNSTIESSEMSILPDLADDTFIGIDPPNGAVVKPVQIKQEKYSGIPTITSEEPFAIKSEPFYAPDAKKKEKDETSNPTEKLDECDSSKIDSHDKDKVSNPNEGSSNTEAENGEVDPLFADADNDPNSVLGNEDSNSSFDPICFVPLVTNCQTIDNFDDNIEDQVNGENAISNMAEEHLNDEDAAAKEAKENEEGSMEARMEQAIIHDLDPFPGQHDETNSVDASVQEESTVESSSDIFVSGDFEQVNPEEDEKAPSEDIQQESNPGEEEGCQEHEKKDGNETPAIIPDDSDDTPRAQDELQQSIDNEEGGDPVLLETDIDPEHEDIIIPQQEENTLNQEDFNNEDSNSESMWNEDVAADTNSKDTIGEDIVVDTNSDGKESEPFITDDPPEPM